MNPRHRQLPGSLSRRGPPRHAELARPARAAPSWPASLATPLAAIDALPPALAWLLGLLVAIAVVIVVHWQHPHTLWLALALPWLAVYLTRGAGVRPTGPARELRGRLVAIVAIAAIGTGVVIASWGLGPSLEPSSPHDVTSTDEDDREPLRSDLGLSPVWAPTPEPAR